MRRGIGLVVLILLIAGGVALGVGAYNAGVNHGEAQALVDSANGTQVVHVVETGRGWGFLPFGFLFFPFLLFGFFALMRIMFWRRAWGHHGHGHGPGGPMGGPMTNHFEEWHRSQHEGADAGGSSPPAPAA
jgi:hypothetical protein